MWRGLVFIVMVLSAGPGRVSPAAQGVDAGARRAEMQDHYSQLLAVHDAVVRGDVEAARPPATELAYLSVPPGSPLASATFGTAIREHARRVARETTVIGAARATAALIRACAECHRTNGAAISAESIARRRRDVPESMADHVRAADDLLLGLLIPSDARWAAGANGLELSLLTTPGGEQSAALRYVTGRSRRAETPTARASNYVHLLTTCAECHQRARR
jgi:cytochrome c553